MLKKVIETLETATGLTAYPLYTTAKSDCLVYTYTPISDDGAVSKNRIEVRVITKTVSDAEEYRKEIIAALVPSGDNVKIEGILSCQLNGGGMLTDGGTDTIHTLLYFDWIQKSNNTYV